MFRSRRRDLVIAVSVPPRLKSALLWGAVGFLSVLALVQGYALLEGPFVSIVQGFLLALVVGASATGVTYVLEYRIAAWAARRRSS